MIQFKFDLCTYTTNKKGYTDLTTRFSNFEEEWFETKEQAKLYAKGMCRGLSYKYKSAAIRMRWNDTEYIVIN
jgi:hypothetical protein